MQYLLYCALILFTGPSVSVRTVLMSVYCTAAAVHSTDGVLISIIILPRAAERRCRHGWVAKLASSSHTSKPGRCSGSAQPVSCMIEPVATNQQPYLAAARALLGMLPSGYLGVFTFVWTVLVTPEQHKRSTLYKARYACTSNTVAAAKLAGAR